jgi:hypothetical protein
LFYQGFSSLETKHARKRLSAAGAFKGINDMLTVYTGAVSVLEIDLRTFSLLQIAHHSHWLSAFGVIASVSC